MMTFDLFVSNSCATCTTKALLLCTVFLLANLHLSFALRADDVSMILSAHNDFRRRFASGSFGVFVADMTQMKWSRKLQLKAERILDCQYERIYNRIPPYEIGSNFGSILQGNISSIIQTWIAENRHFMPSEGVCLHLNQCRHFMTLINAKHHSVGCAYRTRCLSGTRRKKSLLCLYNGGKTIIPAYKTGPVCTKCGVPQSFCDHGLCTSCSRDDELQCDCRKTCNRAGIGEGQLDNTTCTCHCAFGLGPNCDEDCVNPQSYIDFDICQYVDPTECTSGSPEDIAAVREFCPATCTCRRHPDAIATNANGNN